jgi:hypothetical protein
MIYDVHGLQEEPDYVSLINLGFMKYYFQQPILHAFCSCLLLPNVLIRYFLLLLNQDQIQVYLVYYCYYLLKINFYLKVKSHLNVKLQIILMLEL